MKAFYVVIAIVAVLIGLLCLMFFRAPANYKPAPAPEGGRVSLYFTNHIAPEFFNNVQLDDPFSLVVEQAGFNEVLADGTVFGWDWPVELSGVMFTAPAAVIVPGQISLMGTIHWKGLPIVLTIVIEPALLEDGFLALNFRQFKAGVLDITPLAKYLAARIIADSLEDAKTDTNDLWLNGLYGAFLRNEPFEPLFPSYDNRHVRLTEVTIESQKLTLTFQPE